MSDLDTGTRRDWHRSTVAHRFALGPAPVPLAGTREAVLVELVRARRLGRRDPTSLDLGRSLGLARSTIRFHLRALRRDGWAERDPVFSRSFRATEAALENYPMQERGR